MKTSTIPTLTPYERAPLLADIWDNYSVNSTTLLHAQDNLQCQECENSIESATRIIIQMIEDYNNPALSDEVRNMLFQMDRIRGDMLILASDYGFFEGFATYARLSEEQQRAIVPAEWQEL